MLDGVALADRHRRGRPPPSTTASAQAPTSSNAQPLSELLDRTLTSLRSGLELH
jgi:hypothetical protein